MTAIATATGTATAIATATATRIRWEREAPIRFIDVVDNLHGTLVLTGDLNQVSHASQVGKLSREGQMQAVKTPGTA